MKNKLVELVIEVSKHLVCRNKSDQRSVIVASHLTASLDTFVRCVITAKLENIYGKTT
jgi:hypothetical protein